MKTYSRILVAVISLSLIIAYFVPIWDIQLEAPQYPEGLGMQIWLHQLGGDIQTINGLNHYIGMQEINADSIPELKYMPYLLGLIIALGLITAAVGKKSLLYTWVIVFLLLGVAGGVDFYLWEYDYGHNLDPRAAIKVPGMNYQPPLLGSKELLNFIAHSYPATGGYVVIFGGLFAAALAILALKDKKKASAVGNYGYAAATLVISSLLLASCSAKPEPIKFGKEACHHCKMSIADQKFGAEMVTNKGKIFKFDAMECMVAFHNELAPQKQQDIKHLLVVNAAEPGILIDSKSASYLISEKFPSPMGANLSAYKTPQEAENFKKEFSGAIVKFDQAIEYLNQSRGHN